MVKTKISRTDGYSLTEMLIVVAIMGIVALIGPVLFTKMTQFYTQNTARTDIQRELRVAIDNINRTTRQASANTITVTQDTGQPPYSKISFVTVDGSSVTYRQSGRNLIQNINNNQKTLTQNLHYISFTYPQTDISTVMSISITLQKKIYSGQTTALQMAITKVRIMNP